MSEISEYGQTQGLQLLQAVIEEFGPVFSLKQARLTAIKLNMKNDRVVQDLSSLASGKWISRIKRGLYIVQSPLFVGEIHPFSIATNLIQPSAVSHWSALTYHGMTTQIPRMIQVSTPKKVVTPEMRQSKAYRPRDRAVWKVKDLEVEFIQVKLKHFFGFDQEWVSEWNRVFITDRERTILDLIIYPKLFGGINFSMEILEININILDLEKLVNYLLHFDRGSIIKRAGWMLETLGTSEGYLKPLLDYKVKNDYLLDPQGLPDGIKVKRWQIINNIIN